MLQLCVEIFLFLLVSIVHVLSHYIMLCSTIVSVYNLYGAAFMNLLLCKDLPQLASSHSTAIGMHRCLRTLQTIIQTIETSVCLYYYSKIAV